MKRFASRVAFPAALAFATAALFGFIVLASSGTSHAAGMAAAGKASKAENVEARIEDLHARLKITPEQEELWKNVTQVMRDNGSAMQALIKARTEKAGSMTAVDDLKSYSEIAEAHADGLKKFIPAFEPLYASMSDDQKKDADKLFQHYGKTKSKAKAKAKAKAKVKAAE